MPSMTNFEFGDVVLVPFPFTDQSTTKKRPAVVISSSRYHLERQDLLLLAITSQIRPESRIGEMSIAHWHDAGLIKPSVFKPLIATIDRNIVIRTLGSLVAADREILQAVLKTILG